MSVKIKEKEIQKQSKLLEKKISQNKLDKSLFKGKFVAFYNDDIVVGDSHEECFKKAEEHFGSKAFVIDELTGQKLFLSSLIKL